MSKNFNTNNEFHESGEKAFVLQQAFEIFFFGKKKFFNIGVAQVYL